MKTQFLAIAFLLAGFFSLAPALNKANAQTTTNTFRDIAVVLTDEAGNQIAGTLDIKQFVRHGQDGINAIGTLTAMGTSRAVQVPVTINQASCTILDLHLGAINLNLLGLHVDLSPVDLLISADPVGGLLGTLLCAIANLLNIGNILSIVQTLNAILVLLG